MTREERRSLDVSKAAIMLDFYQPGWAERVDVTRLYLHSTHNCVLGQCWKPASRFSLVLLLKRSGASGYGLGREALSEVIERHDVHAGVFANDEYYHEYWVEEIADRLFGRPMPECAAEEEPVFA